MMTFTINLIGILTIALILWWFVFKKPLSTNVKGDVIKIIVIKIVKVLRYTTICLFHLISKCLQATR